MSCVCILTPVVLAAWPAFSEAVTAVAVSLGYAVVRGEAKPWFRRERAAENRVALSIERSEIVTDSLSRDQRITVSRDGVTVVFARDERGRASLCVSGGGRCEPELRALGEDLARRVVQRYVYQRIVAEAKARGFQIVEEAVGADRAIRLRVRHWES